MNDSDGTSMSAHLMERKVVPSREGICHTAGKNETSGESKGVTDC